MAIKPVDIGLYGNNVEAARRPSLSSGLIATFGYMEWNPQPEGFIPDHVERTLGLLIEQFRRERPFINGLVSSVARLLQDAENVLYELQRFRSVAQASAEQLNLIGEMVGIARTDPDDEVYRKDIYFQVYLNTSNGEPEILISCLQKVTRAVRIEYAEFYPASIIMTINQALTGISHNLVAKMNKIRPAGVRLELRLNNSIDQFIFGGEMNDAGLEIIPPKFTGDGFGETGAGWEAVGGNITELLAKDV